MATTKKEAILAVSVPGFQSVSFPIPFGNTVRNITFAPGYTNVYEELVADYLLGHPQVELLTDCGLLELKDVVNGKRGLLFEQADSKLEDAMPVGDLPELSATAERVKTEYREGGGDKAQTEAVVESKKKTTRRGRKPAAKTTGA